MYNKIRSVVLVLSLILSGCATAPKSVLLGAAIGGASGAAIGQNQSHDSQGTMTGLAIGAGIGGIIGYLAHIGKKTPAKTDSTTSNDEYNFPDLTKPKLRSVWVPDKIEGNKYIKGHWIYVIEDAGSWSK